MFRRTLCVTLLALAWNAPVRAAEEKETPTATVAHIKLSGSFDEEAPGSDPLFGTMTENFRAKIERIKKAGKDDKIKGLYLQIDSPSLGLGKLDELSRAIADFRKTGKKAFAFVESGEPRDYLLALACDEVCMPESGWLMLVGMRMEVTFYKDLFDKVGIKADMLQMGEFKGAAEPYIRNSMSEPLKKQLTALLDDNFDKGLVARIAKARNLSEDKVPPVDRRRAVHRQGRAEGRADRQDRIFGHVPGFAQGNAQGEEGHHRQELWPAQEQAVGPFEPVRAFSAC